MNTVDQAARLLASILALLVTMSTLPATAQTLDEAADAYMRGDYVTALLGLDSYIKNGDARAQFMIGHMYDNGEGLPQDDVEAVSWYRFAAEQGFAMAQFSLGRMYAKGRGVLQDDAEAVRWYRLAAEQGDARGQLHLGLMYANGRGVAQNDAEAVWWCRLAAEQGEADAQLLIGFEYELGKRVVRNLVQAYKWYNLAASRFKASDQRVREKAVRSRERVASRLTPTELAKAQVLAREWRPGGRVAQQSARPELDPSRRPLERESTGSGFEVSAQGHILTNAHVVRGCTEVRIPSVGPVHVTAHEDSSDLALLQAPVGTARAIARFRQGRGIRPGASVVVVGYPLRGLLASGANASTGAVSALAGPGDDRRLIQISAPIQLGNSGGPVLDTAGNVVGVVVAKLDALEIARSIGDIPQNVNFAVSAGSARVFLDDNGILYETAPSDKPMESVEIAAAAKKFTVLVECWN